MTHQAPTCLGLWAWGKSPGCKGCGWAGWGHRAGVTGVPLQRWSGPEKLLALDELIDRCEPAQIKYMMQVIEPQFQRDFISLLPKEVREAGGPGT